MSLVLIGFMGAGKTSAATTDSLVRAQARITSGSATSPPARTRSQRSPPAISAVLTTST